MTIVVGMPDSAIGLRIMQRLRELDRSRGWLARQVSKDLSTVHRWISGDRAISEEDLRDIALVLHRPVGWLRGEEDLSRAEEDLAPA